MPFVSILLPVFNGARYLDQSIQSVLAQSCDEWELIIQDDGSQDDSDAIIKKYKDSRISYARNNSTFHIAGNINTALRRARGQYIQLLGQDDRLLANCIEEQLRAWQSHPDVGFSFCPPIMINADGDQLLEASHIWDIQYENTPQVCNAEEALLLFFDYGCLPGNISTVMIRRDCLEQVGVFNPNYRICLDWEMWIRLAKIYGFGFIRERLVELRIHKEQESTNAARAFDRISEIYRCLDLIEQALPSEFRENLRRGRQKKYGAEAINCAIHAAGSIQIKKALELLRVTQKNDSLGLASLFWILEIPRRLRRRLSGVGSLSLSTAFDNEWLLDKQKILREKAQKG